MITDIFMAAMTGSHRSLPFSVPADPDIAAFRSLLSIDAAVPASYVPLIRIIGAFTYVTDGLPIPVPPSSAMPAPSITFNGSAIQPAWTCARPPTFIHKPSQLPVPTVWTLTCSAATVPVTATLTNDAGGAWLIKCHRAQDGTVIPEWPAEAGSNMGVVIPDGSASLWAAGTPVIFHVPPNVYPFAFADKMLAARPEIMSLLESAGAANLHASLLRPAERVAVVAAAVVKRFVAHLITVSDGASEKWYLDPRLLAWGGRVISVNSNIFYVSE